MQQRLKIAAGSIGRKAPPPSILASDKGAISGGLVTAEKKGVISATFPRERRGLDRRPVSPRYTPTAIGAAHIPPKISDQMFRNLEGFF
jgi:hypothetical protein